MISPRNKYQPALFSQAEFVMHGPPWTVVTFAIDATCESGHDVIRRVSRALKQALENVSGRRDPSMSHSSFDVFAWLRADTYQLAIPEDINPAVAGMVHRKILEVPGVLRMERKVAVLDQAFRPAGFYEAGSVWVLRTLGLPGEGPFGALSYDPIRLRMGRLTAAVEQTRFDY